MSCPHHINFKWVAPRKHSWAVATCTVHVFSRTTPYSLQMERIKVVLYESWPSACLHVLWQLIVFLYRCMHEYGIIISLHEDPTFSLANIGSSCLLRWHALYYNIIMPWASAGVLKVFTLILSCNLEGLCGCESRYKFRGHIIFSIFSTTAHLYLSTLISAYGHPG